MKIIIITIASLLLLVSQPFTAIAMEGDIIEKNYINSKDRVEWSTGEGVTFIFDNVHAEKDYNVGCDITKIKSETFGELSRIEFDVYDYSLDLITIRIPYSAKDGTKIYILKGESDYTYYTYSISEVVDNYFEFDVQELDKYTFSESDVASIIKSIGELKKQAITVENSEVVPVSESVKKIKPFTFFFLALFSYAALITIVRFIAYSILKKTH